MRTLTPSHIVLSNGAVGSLTGDNALKAAVGEKVLIVTRRQTATRARHLIGGHAIMSGLPVKFRNPPDVDQRLGSYPAARQARPSTPSSSPASTPTSTTT